MPLHNRQALLRPPFAHFAFFVPKGVKVPVIASAKHDKGGHFAAWEQPKSITLDLRAGFQSLRN
jgi:hypothetical protein